MKKIMFNDKYGLTQAVLEGRKTMTRRVANLPAYIFDWQKYSPYKVGEVVAVAQNYKDAGFNRLGPLDCHGYDNKMFVSARLMPHQIRITNVRVERLQDISDEDCLREGVYHQPYEQEDNDGLTYWKSGYAFKGSSLLYDSPRYAFAALIDKVSGKGTWESNPYVFVYEFELVK